MIFKPVHSEVSTYAAGAVVGAAAMLLALLPHLDIGPTGSDARMSPRMSPSHAEALRSPIPGQSLYAAAKIGLPPGD
jgi:hypothetical protein